MNIFLEENEYQKHFKELMKKNGIKDIKSLSKKEKKEFFNKVDASWNSEKEPGKDGKTK